MAGSRSYMLLCPIARALDRVGDRWTLLILRDLHAGPARFSELQAGLSGIASNLLTNRLQQLLADGLVEQRKAEFGVVVYELSALGMRTGSILFELALLGGQLPPPDTLKRPGNLRTVAVTLQSACNRVVTSDLNFRASLVVDQENFCLSAKSGKVTLRYQKAKNPDVELMTEYEPMMAAAEGRLSLQEFTDNHAKILSHSDGKAEELMTLMANAMQILSKAGDP